LNSRESLPVCLENTIQGIDRDSNATVEEVKDDKEVQKNAESFSM
jgi:hypothetical protein